MNQTTDGNAAVPSPAVPDASMHDMLRMMDVASELRRSREAAEAQLDIAAAKARLRERLHATAAAAGEAVTAAEVDAAIASYFAQQHRYQDPPAGWGTFWAHLWVSRGHVLAGVAVLGFLLLGAIGIASLVTREGASKPAPPTVVAAPPESSRGDTGPGSATAPVSAGERAWQAFLAASQAAQGLAATEEAKQRVGELVADADGDRDRDDAEALQRRTRALVQLREQLAEVYTVRIVSRPGHLSGVDRYVDGRLSGYYLIVEAIDGSGRALPRSIRNAETGATERVTQWGERVDDAVWQRVVADKQADGVVDDDVFAEKLSGHLGERIVLHGADGQPLRRGRQITRW